jgi:hypothetical protein
VKALEVGAAKGRDRREARGRGGVEALIGCGKKRFPKARYISVTLGATLMMAGCTQEEATNRLRADLHSDQLGIVHARFPCRSPDFHIFGYRFRITVKEEYALGDICWDFAARKWSWQILPEYSLSRLNTPN